MIDANGNARTISSNLCSDTIIDLVQNANAQGQIVLNAPHFNIVGGRRLIALNGFAL